MCRYTRELNALPSCGSKRYVSFLKCSSGFHFASQNCIVLGCGSLVHMSNRLCIVYPRAAAQPLDMPSSQRQFSQYTLQTRYNLTCV